jgi:hypothetical protein
VRPSQRMWQLTLSPLELVLRSVLVYVLFLAALRLSGKRELGQFTIFDLALVLLAANALQPAITGPDASLTAAATRGRSVSGRAQPVVIQAVFSPRSSVEPVSSIMIGSATFDGVWQSTLARRGRPPERLRQSQFAWKVTL